MAEEHKTEAREHIDVHVNTRMDSGPDNHLWTVIGTLLACGALGMLGWAISESGYRELAATGLTMFAFQLISMMFKVGLIRIPDQATGNFKETSGFIKTAIREFYEWQARSPVWRLAALALAFTLGFLIVRWGISTALGIFSNVWIAGAAAAFLASLIVAPRLWGNITRNLKNVTSKKEA
ncbi:hypothetical protein [Nesterenkonia aerolata]|uniref:Uncharacterized protein n=1 Tax=Nesterenkonia aerolata TaxID=3074079 RepID=A0ABU2DRT6_9MICC|nr:hypothetical protein [Nesterenkonia sp. LY-0111]MDR8019218.1 hypothetical protein [Nesterenkonia sp. LY-0111]